MLRRPPTERELIAERIPGHMDGPVTALGVIFVLLVLADTVSHGGERLRAVLETATWVVWAALAFEFALRIVIAPSTWAFLRRNWWQLVLLVRASADSRTS